MGGQGLFTSLPSKYKNYNLGESLLDGPEHVPLLGQDVLHVEELAARLQHALDLLNKHSSDKKT